MMRYSALLLAFVALACCHAKAANQTTIDESHLLSGVWMHVDSKWEKAPPEAEVDESTAYARLVRFLPNGEFSWMACIVRRVGQRTVIGVGDGQVIFMGRWRSVGEEIEVQYVKVYELVRSIDGNDPPFGKVDQSTVRLLGNELTFDGRTYSRSNAPDVKEYDSEYIAPEQHKHGERLRTYFQP